MSETPRDFSKPVKVIYNLLEPEQQELMRFSLESMTGYIKQTQDTTGKGAEAKFRTFMILYRHWLISERKVPIDYFGNNFMNATTDELWQEAKSVYRELKAKKGEENELIQIETE